MKILSDSFRTMRFLVPWCGLLFSLNVVLAGPVVPLKPESLLDAAPLVPDDWKMTVSRGQSLLSGGGMPVCVATRVYEVEIPIEGAPPKKVRVTMNLQDQAGDFALQENSFGDGVETISMSGRKVPLLPLSETSTLVQINLPPRLGLSITIEGMENKEVVAFLKKIDLSPYLSLVHRLPSQRYSGSQFTLELVDEMQPSRNGEYPHGMVETAPQSFDPPPAQ